MPDSARTGPGRDSWELGEGVAINDDLTALRLLGGGATYEAYLAFDEVTYSAVVVKVVRPSLVEDPGSLRGLRREVAMLGRANHPVVVRGLRAEVEGPQPHVVLEHIDGPRLSTLIRRYGPLQEQQYLPLAIDIASAVHYFGQVDVVHLDIKPSNIIMGSPARLIDLSVARTAAAAADLTSVIGTDAYLSPEQADPARRGGAGPASDVWGLGATLFEAVAGYRPFDLDSEDNHSEAVGTPAPEQVYPQLRVPPRELPGRTPPEVVEVVTRALALEPADRPSPAEIVDLLQPVLHRQPPAQLMTRLKG